MGDLLLLHISCEFFYCQDVSELGIERSTISRKSSSKGTIAHQFSLFSGNLRRTFGPSYSFSGQGTDESFSGINFLFGLYGLFFEGIFII